MHRIGDNLILQGHVLDRLKELPSESVDMCITSPPYWGLRSYSTEPQVWDGVDGCEHEWGDTLEQRQRGATKGKTAQEGNQINEVCGVSIVQGQFCQRCRAWKGELGLEPQFDSYISHLVQVFTEVKRVMKRSATLWVNISDSYACNTSGMGCSPKNTLGKKQHERHCYIDNQLVLSKKTNLPAKSLCGIPERFALAMTDRLGLVRRNTIIWHKPSCMPESVRDRFTEDFEYVYLFSKTGKYYFEQQFEPILYQERWGVHNKIYNEAERKGLDSPSTNPLGRNKRAVWSINNDGFDYEMCETCGKIFTSQSNLKLGFRKEVDEDGNEKTFRICPLCGGTEWLSHFATFPEALVSTPILAGCPKEICTKCGKAREAVYEKENRTRTKTIGRVDTIEGTQGRAGEPQIAIKGYTDCGCGEPFKPGVCLDPFLGSGTVAVVAQKLGRDWIGIELQEKYIKLAQHRLSSTGSNLL